MATTAGSYGVPDPADTGSSTDAFSTSAGFSDFDELTQFGVSPALSAIPVPFAWVDEDTPGGEKSVKARVLQTQPYQDAVRSLYGRDAESTMTLQQQLQAGGFFGKNPYYIPGQPDPKYTAPVWKNVITQAMREQKTPQEIIDAAIEANGGLDAGIKAHPYSGTGAGAVQQTPLMHPDDIRQVAKEISVKVLGRGWNNKQLDSFVQTYQSMQSAAGNAVGTYQNAPSVEAAATTAAERSDPGMAQATKGEGVMDMVLKSFSNLGGGS